MEMAQLDCARRNERKLQRRAGRARRSKWLGRLLFSLTGMGLMILLRMNPAIVADVVAYAHRADQSRPPIIGKPSDVRVRVMPADAVPVRRGNTPPVKITAPSEPDAQAQAEAVGARLKNMNPGG